MNSSSLATDVSIKAGNTEKGNFCRNSNEWSRNLPFPESVRDNSYISVICKRKQQCDQPHWSKVEFFSVWRQNSGSEVCRRGKPFLPVPGKLFPRAGWTSITQSSQQVTALCWLLLGDSHGYHFSVNSDAMRQSFPKRYRKKIAVELTLVILCGN